MFFFSKQNRWSEMTHFFIKNVMFRLDWCRAVLTLIKSRSHVDKHAIQTHTLWIKKFSVVHQIASSCCCCFNYTVHPRISIMTKWTLKWFENRNLKKDKFTLKQKYTGKKKIKTLKWYYITSIKFFFLPDSERRT